jgi:hypothetical protein
LVLLLVSVLGYTKRSRLAARAARLGAAAIPDRRPALQMPDTTTGVLIPDMLDS